MSRLDKFCCDPFKRHEKPQRRDLRPVSAMVIAKCPSFHFEPSNSLCTVCRKAVNSLPSEASTTSPDDTFEPRSPSLPTTNTDEEGDENATSSSEDAEEESHSPKRARLLEGDVEGPGSSSMNDQDEIVQQLKEKFDLTVSRSERLRILTVLPKSWPLKKIMVVFGVSNYMARQAKKLVQEKGILSSPNPKHGKMLSKDTQNLVESFYSSDDVSRVMPGKKDVVSIMTAVGQREHRQKRLLLCNLKEAYSQFKIHHPAVKVGFSKFADLRPKECVLAGASGTHSVCVCVLCIRTPS